MAKRFVYTSLVITIAWLLLCVGETPEYANAQQHKGTVQTIPREPVTAVGNVTSGPDSTHADNSQKEPLYERFWDALIANWPLVVIGVPTILAALRTLNAIKRQGDLQEVALKQWVKMQNWRGLFYIHENGTKYLHIEFDVANPTKLPLTLGGISVTIDGRPNEIQRRSFIPPDDFAVVAIDFKLTEEQFVKWQGNQWEGQKLMLRIDGLAVYTDALQKVRPQQFGGFLLCSHKSGVEFCRYHGGNLYMKQNTNNTNPHQDIPGTAKS